MTTIDLARYDGRADVYDGFNGPAARDHQVELTRLLGAGEGLCLDLDRGTGLCLDAIAARPV